MLKIIILIIIFQKGANMELSDIKRMRILNIYKMDSFFSNHSNVVWRWW